MAISITPLSGGNTPADGSDPRTFPAIWNATATQLEGVADDLDTLEAEVGDFDLNALNGVGITTPVQGDVLTYNGTSWVNGNPAGSILQVVSTTKTDTFTTSSTSFVDLTGLSVSITPSSASNKIVVSYQVNGAGEPGISHGMLQLVRNSTAIAIGDAAGSRTPVTGFLSILSGSESVGTSAMTFLDSPASTSALTYKVQIKSNQAGTTFVNRGSTDSDLANRPRSVSTITVMEVAG